MSAKMKTLEQITEDFKRSIMEGAKTALDTAYSDFVNHFTPYIETDTTSNAYSLAKDMVKNLLAGKEVALIPSGLFEYSHSEFKAIRDLIWAENGDAITKKVIEDKDREIENLKKWLSHAR
jgi:enolase